MHWLTATILVIILIIVGFGFFIFMPKPTVFFPPYTDTIQIFVQNHDDLKEEALQDTKTPVIPIYGRGEIKSDAYPKIYECLKCMPYVRYAGIINIKPKFEQKPEYGYDIVANHTIRYFYTFKAAGANKSGIWIDGEKRFFTEKEWICGDMSREHRLFNKLKKTHSSTVLFVDIDRHQSIHEGRSPNTDASKDEVLKLFYEKIENIDD